MVFIGFDYEGYPISIVNAKSIELAYAYWQGAGILPNSHKSLEEDYTNINDHATGVYPILKTEEVSDYDLANNCRNPKGKKYLLISK